MKLKSSLILGFCLLLLTACSYQGKVNLPQETTDEEGQVQEAQAPKAEVEYVIEEFASGLEIPWDMAFTSEDRMLVTERPGRLRVIENGVLQEEPLHVFENVSSTGEEGLMSIALDPDYRKNHWIYLSWAYQTGDGMKVEVSRFEDLGNHIEKKLTVLRDLPAARYHAGCRIRFGPDGKLYITVGDALNKENAQDLKSLAGKILRANKDGSLPRDNPFEGSYIWSYGHRNPQGIDWHPETGQLYETEHGPSIFDGPAGGDEVNKIVKGGNYGWPVVSHDRNQEGMIAPLIQFTPAEPPGSLLIYSGKAFPQFKNNLFFGSLGGEGLMRIVLGENGTDILSADKMEEVNFGRIRTVIEAADGSIYFSTSNRDGRGHPDPSDDRIFRIRPIYR